MNKEQRQQAILDLIYRDDISSQEKLRKRLVATGFDVTQATLSRDLRELSVVKKSSQEGKYKYTILNNWEGLSVLRCEVSGNLLVFQTEPGLAPAVAYKIDGLQLGSILGTVAGENTLLAVVAEGHDARKVRKELWNRIQEA
ncbi:MAG: ArgR family transcriptional regulator [Acidobacteriota bacterium]